MNKHRVVAFYCGMASETIVDACDIAMAIGVCGANPQDIIKVELIGAKT